MMSGQDLHLLGCRENQFSVVTPVTLRHKKSAAPRRSVARWLPESWWVAWSRVLCPHHGPALRLSDAPPSLTADSNVFYHAKTLFVKRKSLSESTMGTMVNGSAHTPQQNDSATGR